MALRLLEKYLTRDVPLIVVESWYEGVVNKTSEFFEAKFPENVFVYRNNVFECFHDSQRYLFELPLELSKWAANNKAKISESYLLLRDSIATLNDMNISDDLSNRELIDLLNKCREILVEGMIGLVTTNIFPLWQELFLERDQRQLFSQDLIDEAIRIRAETDIFFSLTSGKIIIILETIARNNYWRADHLHHVTYVELTEALARKRLNHKIIEFRFCFIAERTFHGLI